MKKKFLLIMISIILIGVLGCSKHNSYFKIQNADSISILYGSSSNAFCSTDEEIINSISENLNSLSFQKTDKQLHVFSMYTISLSKNNETVAFICVDDQGVFCIDDTGNRYVVKSGNFDYNFINDTYRQNH